MAAAPSSSHCEVMDIAMATSREDATSDAGDFSRPAAAAAGISSTLTDRRSLVSLCDKYGVPREFKPVCAGVLGCTACDTPPKGSNALCVYSDALEAGLRFPLHDFYVKLLRHYGLAPSQLVPNAWKYMAAFVQRCEDAGVEPQVSTFRYFFALYAHYHNVKSDRPMGWHHFQPCAGRPRLFSGTLPTRNNWKTRFFFLRAPEGMPWKCPVAWGTLRAEDACTVEVADAAVDKLKQMPCVDFKDFLSLHALPVGALTLLQPAPMPKPECARALALSPLPATVEVGATGEGDDDSTPRKRRCAGPGPAAVTSSKSVAISAAPQSLQGMETTPGTSFDGAAGSCDISLPPGAQTGNSDNKYDMARMQDEQLDNQKIAQLQVKLRESEALSDKFVEFLHKKNVENDLLKEKQARLIEEQAAVVARLKAEHASAVEQLTKQLDEEHVASIARLKKEHAAELARVKDAAEKKLQDVRKNVVRMLYPHADLSQLEGPKLKGDLAAAGTSEAQGRSATS